MTQANLTRAGHTLYIDEVTVPYVGTPGSPGDWVWWVNDPTSTMVLPQKVLCFGALTDSDKYKAYSEAEYRLRGKVEVLEFDQLDWS